MSFPFSVGRRQSADSPISDTSQSHGNSADSPFDSAPKALATMGDPESGSASRPADSIVSGTGSGSPSPTGPLSDTTSATNSNDPAFASHSGSGAPVDSLTSPATGPSGGAPAADSDSRKSGSDPTASTKQDSPTESGHPSPATPSGTPPVPAVVGGDPFNLGQPDPANITTTIQSSSPFSTTHSGGLHSNSSGAPGSSNSTVVAPVGNGADKGSATSASHSANASATHAAAHPAFSPAVGSASSSRSEANRSSDGDTGANVGTIMGVLVAALAGMVIAVGLFRMLVKRKKKPRAALDFDDSPFADHRAYGREADLVSLKSDDSRGPIMARTGGKTDELARSLTTASRTGGAYGPRPPSIIQRHFAAPSLPPPMPSFQPGQVVNPSYVSPSVYSSRPAPPPFIPYPSDTSLAYANDVMTPPPAPHSIGGSLVTTEKTDMIERVPPPFFSPPPALVMADRDQVADADPHHVPDGSRQATYHNQVQQLDFGPPFAVPAAAPPLGLKNPYADPPAVSSEARSGTPDQPNMQQSYFDRGSTGQVDPDLVNVQHGHPADPSAVPASQARDSLYPVDAALGSSLGPSGGQPAAVLSIRNGPAAGGS